jgi:hypothetical protein
VEQALRGIAGALPLPPRAILPAPPQPSSRVPVLSLPPGLPAASTIGMLPPRESAASMRGVASSVGSLMLPPSSSTRHAVTRPASMPVDTLAMLPKQPLFESGESLPAPPKQLPRAVSGLFPRPELPPPPRAPAPRP